MIVFIFRITVVRLLYAQRWKITETPIMEKQIVKRAEFAEMANLTCLIKEGITTTFTKAWKPFISFWLKVDKNELSISGFIDQKDLFMGRREAGFTIWEGK